MEERDGEFEVNTRTVDKYCLRVRRAAGEKSPFDIKVSNDPKKILTTVVYVRGVFQRGASDSVSIKAMGKAIPKAVRIAEIVKYSVFDLHQINSITNMEVEDVYVPLEEGLDEVILRKKISVLEIVLLRTPSETIKGSIGYQAPLERGMVRPARRGGFRPRVGARYSDAPYQPMRTARARPRFSQHYDQRRPPQPFRGYSEPVQQNYVPFSSGTQFQASWHGSAPAHLQPNFSQTAPEGVFRVRGGRAPQPHYRPRIMNSERHEAY